MLDGLLQKSLENDLESQNLANSTPICRHTDTGNKGYTFNNIIKDVDNPENTVPVANANSLGYDTGHTSKRRSLSLTSKNDVAGYKTSNAVSGYTGEKEPGWPASLPENMHGAGEKVRRRAGESENEEENTCDTARSASLTLYVSLLWNLAKNLLYKDTYLTPRQEEIGQKLLYEWYEPVSTDSLTHVHQIYVERIGLVRKFIDKDPEKRYVQLPYRYFDTTNPDGFTGTKKWWEKYRQHKAETRDKLILHAQIRRFVNNEKKDLEKQKPRLSLYRECETRVGKLGDASLLQQFHAAVLDPVTHCHVYPITNLKYDE